MNFDETTQQYLKELSNSFLTKLIEQTQADVGKIVNEKISKLDISKIVEDQINLSVAPFFGEDIKKKIQEDAEIRFSKIDIHGLINEFVVRVLVPRIEEQTKETVIAEVMEKLKSFNIADYARQQSSDTIKNLLQTFAFPDNSIPGKAVSTKTIQISGDNISGGIIKRFESTGIQDRATGCQVTILDKATVFENKLVAGGLEIAGDAVFKGNLAVHGVLPKDSPFVNQVVGLVVDSFNDHYDMIEEYATLVHRKLSEDGMDVSVISHDGSPLVENNSLNGKIVNSNLQSVGALKELQVIGETLLDQTLYVSTNRVGINTIEPERTLDLWDHEIQIIAGKRQQDVAMIGTIRSQDLVITANNKDQLVVNTDGSVTIKSLNIGRSNHSSSSRRPTDNRPAAHIVWNETPTIGSPVGWVSLGGARWAPFGIITT